MRIGLFGGTFNPVHLGHVAAARAAMTALQLDRLLFIPSGHPPLKGAHGLVAGHHRAAMLRLAIHGDPAMDICDLEIARSGPSYTVDTVRTLASAAAPGTSFHFLLGSDCLDRLPQWKGIDELQQMLRFAIISRNGQPLDRLTMEQDAVVMEPLALSSTEVRQAASIGSDVSPLVGDGVARYIVDHRLYLPVTEVAE
jgi:nicotinate-nucleotide adenylyltransferase